MVKVSVIIPVYNGEKHLRQCLDSVCQQTLEEIEIICVDDGSTDSSREIIKEYQEKDERVKFYQQANQYAGAARNLGKANAQGEYLVFWDCDDFFELTALEIMYNRVVETNADICVCGARRYYEDKQKLYPWPGYMSKKKIPKSDSFNRITNEAYILNFTNEAAWNKMFRREFVEERKLDFQCIRNGNDVYFTINALCMADTITAVETPLVNYRKNQSTSLVGTLSKSAKTPFQAWIDTAENLKKQGIFPEKSFVNKFCSTMIYLLRNIRNRQAFYEVVEFLKKDGFDKLSVYEREEEFYYNKTHAEIVKHMLNDTPEDFRDYLMYVTYIQLTEDAAKIQLKNAEIAAYKKRISELETELKNVRLSRKVKNVLKATPVYPLYKKIKNNN